MVTATTQFPEEHASLSDGTTTIKFRFTDGDGKVNPLAFRASPYPRTALKTTSGESKYSDLEPPYFAIAQDDWTGGRGNEDFENDASRYNDGYVIDTSKESGVVLGGRESYAEGHVNTDQVMPGDMSFASGQLYGDQVYIAASFTASASYTSYQCEVWIKRVGTPGNIKCELWSESVGEPNSMLASKTLTPSSVTSETLGITTLTAFVWTGSPGLTASTDYYVVLVGNAGDTATNHWVVGHYDSTGQKSSDGSTWSNLDNVKPYFRITPAGTSKYLKCFKYKGSFYGVEILQSGSSKLYIMGDRGVADASTTTTLLDGTKTGGSAWTSNEFQNDIVYIVAGKGSDQKKPWRPIAMNDGNTLTLTSANAWDIAPDTTSEYVIIGKKWRELATLNVAASDVAVIGSFVYFTSNDDTDTMDRMIEYNDNGTFTRQVTSDVPPYGKIVIGLDQDENKYLFYTIKHSTSTTAERKNGTKIYKGLVPEYYHADADVFYSLGDMVETNKPWDALNTTNVTVIGGKYTQVSCAAGFTTGIAAARNLDTPLDITEAAQIRATVQSSVAVSSGEWEIAYDDVEDLGKTWSPAKVFYEDNLRYDTPVYLGLEADFDGTPAFTEWTETSDQDTATVTTVSITEDDYLWIGYSEPFDCIYFDLGTVNAVDTPMTLTYYEGRQWVAPDNIVDATLTGTTPLTKDGEINFSMPAADQWVASTVNSIEAYWIRIRFASAALTPNMTFLRIYALLSTDTSSPSFNDLVNTYDGDTTSSEFLEFRTEDYLYVGYGTKFNKITVDVGTANDIASVLTAQYFNGSAWTAVTITDNTKVSGDTLKQDGTITFTIPNDWEANTVNSTETYWIRLDVSVALTTAFSINEITVTRSNNVTVDIPALEAGEWHTCVMSLPTSPYPAATTAPDDSAIRSVGINVATDPNPSGVKTLFIKEILIGGSTVQMEHEAVKELPDENVNGLEIYSGNVDDPVKNPWILTNKGVYELRTQEDDELVPIPLGELATQASPENGLGHCVNSTYLYFNLGQKIQRYFNRTLDDIGPDRDEGLPSSRQGIPLTMASYAGSVFVGIDGGSNTSSVLALQGTAWHEVFRMPRADEKIRHIAVQAIPGSSTDRLWINAEGPISLWIPISLNPYNDSDYTFTHEGHLTTSYIYANLKDIVKLWKSLKLFIENVASGRYIIADYQVDDDTSWTEIGTFDTVPVEEIDIASTLPQSKRIRFRLRMYSISESNSPRLKAIVTEGVAFVPVKNQYSWSFALKQSTDKIDLFGKYDDAKTSLQDYDQLISWANAGDPLTFRHHSDLYDNKTVITNPVSVSPIRIVDHEGVENHVASITVLEA
jgi:hypothetical protein